MGAAGVHHICGEFASALPQMTSGFYQARSRTRWVPPLERGLGGILPCLHAAEDLFHDPVQLRQDFDIGEPQNFQAQS